MELVKRQTDPQNATNNYQTLMYDQLIFNQGCQMGQREKFIFNKWCYTYYSIRRNFNPTITYYADSKKSEAKVNTVNNSIYMNLQNMQD